MDQTLSRMATQSLSIEGNISEEIDGCDAACEPGISNLTSPTQYRFLTKDQKVSAPMMVINLPPGYGQSILKLVSTHLYKSKSSEL